MLGRQVEAHLQQQQELALASALLGAFSHGLGVMSQPQLHQHLLLLVANVCHPIFHMTLLLQSHLLCRCTLYGRFHACLLDFLAHFFVLLLPKPPR